MFNLKWELITIGGFGVAFGAYALYLGHDTVVVGAVFGLLGTIAGYIVGKKTS